MTNLLKRFWDTYRRDAQNKGLTDEKLINAYCVGQLTAHYIREVSKDPKARVFLTPNLTDPGELLGFMEKDTASVLLTIPRYENTVVPVFSIMCEVCSNSFSISNNGLYSPFGEQAAILVWGFYASDLKNGIITPYAVSMKTLRAVKCSSQKYMLFKKENMLTLPTLYMNRGETQVVTTQKAVGNLKEKLKTNPSLETWMYIPCIC